MNRFIYQIVSSVFDKMNCVKKQILLSISNISVSFCLQWARSKRKHIHYSGDYHK